MEVGLAAPNLLFIPASPRVLREGEARAGYRSSRAEAVAFASCKRMNRLLRSRCGSLPVSAYVAMVGHAFGVGFFVQHVMPALASNLNKSVSPNKAFKNVRFAHWDRRTAGPLISRYVLMECLCHYLKIEL